MTNRFKITWWEFKRVQCNCGHCPKDHYAGEGRCDKYGCTWYYPNDRYIGGMRSEGIKKFSEVEKYREIKRKERGNK